MRKTYANSIAKLVYTKGQLAARFRTWYYVVC